MENNARKHDNLINRNMLQLKSENFISSSAFSFLCILGLYLGPTGGGGRMNCQKTGYDQAVDGWRAVCKGRLGPIVTKTLKNGILMTIDVSKVLNFFVD